MGQLEAVGFAHAESDPLAGQKFGRDGAGHGQKREASLGLAGQAGGISGKAAGSVAAHFGLATICIVITHPVHLLGTLDGDQTISADATMAIAEACDLVAREAAGAVPVVDHDEVVSGSVHLGELENHGKDY
jgi:hypothetical protein